MTAALPAVNSEETRPLFWPSVSPAFPSRICWFTETGNQGGYSVSSFPPHTHKFGNNHGKRTFLAAQKRKFVSFYGGYRGETWKWRRA
jgi:hypothetical protein